MQPEGEEEQGGEEQELEVASIITEKPILALLGIVFLLMVIGSLVILIHKAKEKWKILLFPESGWFMIVGVISGVVLIAIDLDEFLVFDQQVFFLLLLPPIIFASGFQLRADFFFGNLEGILIYACVGTFLANVGIGLLLWGSRDSFTNPEAFGLEELLTFGALIAAVDPVAVLAVFKEEHVNKTLNILVFGESVLNDAVSIVLFSVFSALLLSPFDATIPFIAIAKFFAVSIGGLVIGIICALLSALHIKYTHQSLPAMEVLLTTCWAYLSFLVSEVFEVSGIVAILFCGIIVRRYTVQNLGKSAAQTFNQFANMVAETSELAIFIILGIQTSFQVYLKREFWDPGLILLTILFALVIRFSLTFGLGYWMNSRRKKPVSIKDQFIIAYGGIRGAIAFALVSSLPEDIEARDWLVSTTLAVIWFTVFIQGATVGPIINFLKVKKDQSRAPDKVAGRVLGQGLLNVTQAVHEVVSPNYKFWHNTWTGLDEFIERFVSRGSSPEERKLLHIVRKIDRLNQKDQINEKAAKAREELKYVANLLSEHNQVNLDKVLLMRTKEKQLRESSASEDPAITFSPRVDEFNVGERTHNVNFLKESAYHEPVTSKFGGGAEHQSSATRKKKSLFGGNFPKSFNLRNSLSLRASRDTSAESDNEDHRPRHTIFNLRQSQERRSEDKSRDSSRRSSVDSERPSRNFLRDSGLFDRDTRSRDLVSSTYVDSSSDTDSSLD